jgi:hypothetical protein
MIKHPKQDIMTLSEIPSIEVTGRATARPWHNGLEEVKDKGRRRRGFSFGYINSRHDYLLKDFHIYTDRSLQLFV